MPVVMTSSVSPRGVRGRQISAAPESCVRSPPDFRSRLDELLLDESERSPSEDLRLQFEAARRLPDEARKAVKSVIEGILLKHEAQRWVASGYELRRRRFRINPTASPIAPPMATAIRVPTTASPMLSCLSIAPMSAPPLKSFRQDTYRRTSNYRCQDPNHGLRR